MLTMNFYPGKVFYFFTPWPICWQHTGIRSHFVMQMFRGFVIKCFVVRSVRIPFLLRPDWPEEMVYLMSSGSIWAWTTWRSYSVILTLVPSSTKIKSTVLGDFFLSSLFPLISSEYVPQWCCPFRLYVSLSFFVTQTTAYYATYFLPYNRIFTDPHYGRPYRAGSRK